MKTSTRRPLSSHWLLALTAMAVLSSIPTLAVEPAPGTDSAKAAAAPSAAEAISSEIAAPAPAKDVTKAAAVAKADTSKDTYFLSDYLSTTLGTVDAAGVIDQMETDAFGAPLADGRAPTRYTGKPYDEDMGAYIFPFRNYRPDEARWMTPDPSGFPDGPNNQVYTNNPLTQCDPFGLYNITFGSEVSSADQSKINASLGRINTRITAIIADYTTVTGSETHYKNVINYRRQMTTLLYVLNSIQDGIASSDNLKIRERDFGSSDNGTYAHTYTWLGFLTPKIEFNTTADTPWDSSGNTWTSGNAWMDGILFHELTHLYYTIDNGDPFSFNDAYNYWGPSAAGDSEKNDNVFEQSTIANTTAYKHLIE